jgi:branched-chain amino acid transport system ATP-binding protein
MLKISKLNAGYDDLRVLHSVSLELEKGKVGLLMGPNGAGKSTLLKSIFNLTQSNTGSITFDGQKLTGLPTHRLLQCGIALVPQGKINFGTLTVRENLEMGGQADNLPDVYKLFPVLKERKDELAFRLSGGQQQMLALGRAMMTTPKLLLLDEPSLGLSPKLVKEVIAKVRSINTSYGTTILIVENNIKSVLDIADFGYIMMQGEIVAAEKASKLEHTKAWQKLLES